VRNQSAEVPKQGKRKLGSFKKQLEQQGSQQMETYRGVVAGADCSLGLMIHNSRDSSASKNLCVVPNVLPNVQLIHNSPAWMLSRAKKWNEIHAAAEYGPRKPPLSLVLQQLRSTEKRVAGVGRPSRFFYSPLQRSAVGHKVGLVSLFLLFSSLYLFKF
jgi:hypothetical protein